MPRSISEVNALRNANRAAEAQQSSPHGHHGYDPGRAKTFFLPKNCTQPVAVHVDTTV
jgi:hypothetical protein